MAVSLHANRFAGFEFRHNVWVVVLEAGAKYEDVFAPEFWAHVASQIRPGDIIHVRNDENDLFAELYVRGAGHLYATVAEIRKVEFKDKIAGKEGDLYSKWGGPHHKHSVYRRSDNERLKDGYDTAQDAAFAAIELSKTLAA